MIHVPRYLKQLCYPVYPRAEHNLSSTQPFNKSKGHSLLFLNEKKALLPTMPTNNGILNAPLVNTEANRLIEFPDVKSSWFNDGYPLTITPKQTPLIGKSIDVIPINLVAEEDGFYHISNLSENSYWYSDGQIFSGVVSKSVRAGELIAIGLLSIKDFNKLSGCTISSEGTWELIMDYGTIDARFEADKPVGFISGINEDSAKDLSLAIGYSPGIIGTIEGIRLLSQGLTKSLTNAFPTDIIINKSQSINTTIRFDLQNRQQRIAIYHFKRSFMLRHDKNALEFLSQRLNMPDMFKNIALSFMTNKIIYNTNYIQKVYVLKS